MEREYIQWEKMLPAEFRQAMKKKPVVFMPLGTVEWHGEHNALGLDSLKAHQLCIRAAQKMGGGIVHPPLYGGMGGLDKPATVIMEEEHSWENTLLRPWLERLCSEFQRLGFKAIVMLTGHYGHNQQIVVREVAVRMSQRLQIPVLGTPEYWLAQDIGYLGDHAGIGETSLLAHLYPELVAMERIREDPDYGQTDEIEMGTSKELGKTYTDMIVDRLARIADQMIDWEEGTLTSFIRSEQALINTQVKGWRNKHEWAAWEKMFAGEITQYGALLVEQRFDEIEHLAYKLL